MFLSTSLLFFSPVFIFVLMLLVMSRFRFLLAERGVWLRSCMRGAWIFGSYTHRTGLELGYLMVC